MVELGTTCCRENTGFVHLEDPLICLNGDRNWLLSNSLFQSLGILLGYILEAGDTSLGNTSGAGSCLALSHFSLIRIALFRAQGILLSILEGVVHQTTIAAHVAKALGAIHELLLAQRDQLSCCNLPSTLE
jgi:hypothetical protein